MNGSSRRMFSRRDVVSPQQQQQPHHRSVRFDDSSNDSLRELVSSLGWWMTASVALLCLLGLFILLALLYVTVRPLSKSLHGRLAQQSADYFVDSLVLLLPNIRLHLSGDVPSPIGTSIWVSNHWLDGDWLALLLLGRCVGLAGGLKFCLRNEYFHLNNHNHNNHNHNHNGNNTNNNNGAIINNGNGNHNGRLSPPNNDTTNNTNNNTNPSPPCRDLAIVAMLLHHLLDFPLIGASGGSSTNGAGGGGRKNNTTHHHHREDWYLGLLKSTLAADNSHLVCFPEGWYQHREDDPQKAKKKSDECAQREGRPQLRHLLLPRTREFNATLESLRPTSPVVYDVTVAYSGYNGALPRSIPLSLKSLWDLMRNDFPKQVHVRIKRYSMNEVDTTWLDKKWTEKDRLLSYFCRHESLGYQEHVFDSKSRLETSIVSLGRLLILPFMVPVLIVLSIPLFWMAMGVWMVTAIYQRLFVASYSNNDTSANHHHDESQTPSSAENQAPRTPSASGTPFLPATPFGSPSISWLFPNQKDNRNSPS